MRLRGCAWDSGTCDTASRASDGRLVSVDSTGRAPDVEMRLHCGCVLQSPTSALPGDYDSYQCFYYGRPVVFQVDESGAGLVGPQWLSEQLPQFWLAQRL